MEGSYADHYTTDALMVTRRTIVDHTRAVKKGVMKIIGLNRDLNPGPLAPKARIIPLDH